MKDENIFTEVALCMVLMGVFQVLPLTKTPRLSHLLFCSFEQEDTTFPLWLLSQHRLNIRKLRHCKIPGCNLQPTLWYTPSLYKPWVIAQKAPQNTDKGAPLKSFIRNVL